TSEAAHALWHVGLKTHALLLAVVADVDAGFLLLLDHMAHGCVHLLRHHGRIKGFSRFPPDQQVRQFLVTWQAADMGGENAIPAGDHGGAERWCSRGRYHSGIRREAQYARRVWG